MSSGSGVPCCHILEKGRKEKFPTLKKTKFYYSIPNFQSGRFKCFVRLMFECVYKFNTTILISQCSIRPLSLYDCNGAQLHSFAADTSIVTSVDNFTYILV
jgi:hypothetical protein